MELQFYSLDFRALHITRCDFQLEAQLNIAVVFIESSNFNLQMYTAAAC